MFEAVKLGRRISKQTFKKEEPELRTRLLAAQRAAREARIPVVVIVAGVEAAGKGAVVNRLNEWLDARGLQTFAFWDATDEERQRPRYWRFWRTLPPRGQISNLFGGWYLGPIERRFHDRCNDAEIDAELNRIVDFERMLAHDGTLFVKFWFHLPKDVQKRRLKELARDDRSRWKMLPDKTKFSEQYRKFERVAERVIRVTDRGVAPWHLIEATDRRYRDLTTGRTLLAALESRLAQPALTEEAFAPPAGTTEPVAPEPEAQVTILDRIDLSQRLERDIYKERLKTLQAQANELTWEAYKAKRSCVLVFEGVDAGGKGGAIRRITNAVDARLYRAIPIAAPTEEEKSYHYLWRFWRNIPRAGYMTIYDRSWYGRVLVERVEGFATQQEWQRAYAEINEFEEQLVEHGTVLLKFWLQISPEEQLRRFKQREQTPYKRHKITEEDWRNRERWDDYKIAANEMVARTSTEMAPWTLVAGNDKPFARIQVLETFCDVLSRALKEGPRSDGYLACEGAD